MLQKCIFIPLAPKGELVKIKSMDEIFQIKKCPPIGGRFKEIKNKKSEIYFISKSFLKDMNVKRYSELVGSSCVAFK